MAQPNQPESENKPKSSWKHLEGVFDGLFMFLALVVVILALRGCHRDVKVIDCVDKFCKPGTEAACIPACKEMFQPILKP